MQTMISNGASSVPSTSSPTAAEVHQGQLEDYELLITVLRAYSGSLDDFSQMLIKPSVFSPLDQEHETGQGALQQLLEDADYRALCQTNKVSPNHLIVTLKEGAFVYETFNQDGANKTELTLTGNAQWQPLRTRIEKSVSLIGGQIRYDRLISAPRIATYYAMAPWDPTKPAEHQAAIDALREKIASYQLGLEEDFNLLDLKADFTDPLRQASIEGALTADSQEEMQREFITGEIKRVIQSFLPDGVTSPLTHLANDVLVSAEPERVRAQPTAFLKKILQGAEARKLGDRLLSTLDWYGGKPGEETAPHIRVKVVANALQIWFHSQLLEYPDRIAGYDLQSRSNWGKSYKNIWRAFENHLLTSKRASSEKEAIVMARLYLCQFPAEFRITDIPSELSYRGSVVWVNFVTGVTLVKSATPKALYRQSFQKLVNLPLILSEGASQEHLYEVSLARLLPTVDWAVTQGVIPQKPYEEYSQAETERALSELDKHTQELNEAVTRISEEPPKRLSIAEAEIKKLFKQCDLVSNGRKLARKKFSAGARQASGYDKYSFVDVLASGKFDDKKWWVTEGDGITRTDRWIRIDENRTIKTDSPWVTSNGNGRQVVLPPNAELPDVQALFDNEFKRYLESITSAYETLIRTLLASLPFTDRQALEFGEVCVYSLREQSRYKTADEETAEVILPLRTRNGLILQARHGGKNLYYELLPKAGVIRRLDYFNSAMIGGFARPAGQLIDGTQLHVLNAKALPLDWEAHLNGSAPRKNANCAAIVEILGSAFAAASETTQYLQNTPLTLSSTRSVAISHHIATELLFVDPKALRNFAFGQTQIDRERAELEKLVAITKSFVPFWGSIEDLMSGDRSKQQWGAIGLFLDVLSFALPMGKFAAGSVRLINTAGQIGIRAALPAFGSLTRKLLISTLRAANPLDVIPSLLRGLGNGLRGLGNFVIYITKLTGKGQPYKYVRSLAQLSDMSNWKPLAIGDQLATVKGVDDVSVRNIDSTSTPDYRLLDPLTSKPYGPALSSASGELSLGRSHYSTLENNNSHVMVEVSENTRVREMPEVDGRTTVYLDDVPYRLDDDILRRVNLIDDSEALKLVPCRIRRVPGETVCLNSYVTATVAPTPPIGSVDKSKGYALWFGDSLSTPQTWRQNQYITRDGGLYRVTDNVPSRVHGDLRTLGFRQNYLVPRRRITATIEFRKGIYARINVPGTYEQTTDIQRVGAIVVPAIDDTAVHVFTRVNTDQYYLATVPKGNSLSEPLAFNRLTPADMAHGTLGDELSRVYTGSLNANNTARIHGVEAVERAMKTMEDIAIPLGTTANPASNMRWLKVDTSPAEALMFDHSTRMIVTSLPEGAATWTRSGVAPQAFRQKTAEILDTLFLSPIIKPRLADPYLRIQDTMSRLHNLLPRNTRPANARNIAFADVMTTSGQREIYVSVSGAQRSTAYLPLFRRLGANQVRQGNATYFNIDFNQTFPKTNLNVTPEGKILAIPRTIKDIKTYKPIDATKPTSLDSESKLIKVIREKYPDPTQIRSIDVVSTMRPCESCSVVLQQFGHDGGRDALKVLWN